MAKIFGRGIIAWNGKELQTVEDSITFKQGLSTGKARKGPRGYIGSSVVVGMSEVKCEVIPTDDLDFEGMSKGTEATLRIFDDNAGIEWVIAKAVLSEDPELSEGNSSKWSLEFEGSKAEKV